MSEYIPKYPSEEGDDSNKTSSELLAKTLKPIYVPQDLMLAWESHLASYSRDTHELLDQVKDSEEALNTQYQALLARVQKYEQMLQDITMDSNEFTMDSDVENFTGWNILAQASYWDYLLRKEITKLSDQIKSAEYKGALVTEVTDTILEGLIADNNYISNVIEALSDTPLIRELDAALSSTTSSLTDLQAEYVRLAEKQAADAEALANQQVEKAEQLAASFEVSLAEQLDRIADEAATRTRLLQELEDKTDAMTAEYNEVADTLHTTVIQELTTMQDGISASVSELKTADEAIITSLDAYKVSNGQNIAALQNSVNVVTNTQESIATQITGLIASFNQLDLGLSQAQADIVTSNQARADGDEALGQQIIIINSEIGNTNSRIDTVNTAVSTLDSATATKFSELETTLTDVDNSIASVRQIADSAVSTNIAQASEINTLTSRMSTTEGNVTKKADATALSTLETKVDSADVALANRIDALVANLTTPEGTEINTNTFNALRAEVTNNSGNIATHTSQITALNSSLGNVNTGLSANADAVANLTTTVTQQGESITSHSQAIQQLQADLDVAEAGLATKASTSALNTTNTNVTNLDGRVAANTNSLNSLGSRMGLVEGAISTKLEASALNNYYTKTETDDKATTIAAGEISKYDASLVIGGANLLKNSEGVFTPNGSRTDNYDIYQSSTVDMINGKEYTLSGETNGEWSSEHNASAESNKAVLWLVGNGLNIIISNSDVGTKGRTFVWDNPSGTYVLRLNSYKADNSIWFKNIKIESGNKRTDWTPNSSEVVEQLNANASAIQSTNSEVSRINGVVTAQGTSITALQSGLTTANNNIATKADGSALTALTTRVSNSEDNLQTQSNQITSLTASLNNLKVGGTNLLAKSKMTNGYVDGYTGADGTNTTYLRFKTAEPLSSKRTVVFSCSRSGLEFKVYPFVGTSYKGGIILTPDVPYTFNTDVTTFKVEIGGAAGNVENLTNYKIQLEYGTIPTDWSPAPEDVDAAQSGNASAIAGLQAQVTSIDGLVTANSNSLTTLTSTVNNNYSEMVNSYSTKDNVDEVVSNNIQKYDAQLNTSLPTTQDATQVNMWLATGLNPENRSDWNQNTIPDYSWLRKLSVTDRRYLADGDTLKSGWWVNRIVFFRTIVSVTQAKTINLGNFTGDDGHAIYVNQKKVFEWPGYATNTVSFNLPAGVSIIDVAVSNGAGGAGFSAQNLLSSQVDWMHAPISPEIQASGAATAVTSIQAQVTTLDGKVTANSSQVTTLTTSVDGMKATGQVNTKSVIIDLTGYDEGRAFPIGIPLQYIRNTIRVWSTLDNLSHPSWAIHDGGFVLEYQWNVSPYGWGTRGINREITNASWGWTKDNASPLIKFNQLGNASIEVVWLRGGGKYHAFIPDNSNLIYPDGDGKISSTGQEVRWHYYNEFTPPDAVFQKTEQNTATLQITNQTIDGVKAVSTVSVDNNGFISGYGLISQLVDGVVQSAFGVNADYFYVGTSNSNKKKPFMVLTSPQTINGVTYPAGTWIDVALIANATIGTAHIQDAAITNAKIANLDASKITTGTLDANRIGANTITAEKLTIGDTTNLWGNQYFSDKGAGLLNNNGKSRFNYNIKELKGNGIQIWGRDHVAPYSVRIPVKAGDTIVIECTAGRNSGQSADLKVGMWLNNADGSYFANPYGNMTYIADLGSGWYRCRRIFEIPSSGSGSGVAYGSLYFLIEQSESDSNPAYWTVGDVTVRKAMGGELIVNGAVTADKINVGSLSAISANLGTIQVGTANIADGAITTAKIDDLQVDTLKIKDRAVTAPHFISKAGIAPITLGPFNYSPNTYPVTTFLDWGLTGLPPNQYTMVTIKGRVAVEVIGEFTRVAAGSRMYIQIGDTYVYDRNVKGGEQQWTSTEWGALPETGIAQTLLVKTDSNGNLKVKAVFGATTFNKYVTVKLSHTDMDMNVLELKK